MIDAASAAQLARIPQLETLRLREVDLSQLRTAPLKNLMHLKLLDLTGAKVPPSTIEQLRASLPGCEIRLSD